MADQAVTALVYDASGAEAGARQFQASSQKILAAASQAELGFGKLDAASKRYVTSISSDSRFLDAYARKFDPLSHAVRQAEKDFDRLTRIASGAGEAAERAATQLASAERRLADAKAVLTSATNQSTTALDRSTAAVGLHYQELLRLSRAQSDALASRLQVQQAYSASVAPVDTATMAVKRSYEASIQAGRAQAEEVASRLKVKQAYEASLAPVQHLTAATADQGKVTQAAGAMSRQTAAELKNLGFQINDVVSGLAMGQRPMQIFVQQGGQIAQLSGALRYSFGLLVSPIGLATAAVTAIVGAMVLAIGRAGALDHQLKALKTTLASTGGASGISAADLQAAVNDFARQPGVNRDTATQAAQGLASNPLLNADLLRRALPTVRDFAAATGKEIPDAAKAMAAALTGGYSAAKQLDQQFQLFEPHQLNAIRNFEEQDLKGQAANIVLAAMQEKWKGLADGGLTDAAKAANNFGNAWDKLLDGLSKTWVIKGARQALIDLTNIAGGASTPTSAATGAGLRASGPIGQGILAFVSALGLAGGPATATPDNTAAGSLVGSLSGGFAAIARAADPATAAIDRFNAAAAGGKGALHNMAIQANEAATALDPAGREMERLANEQVKLTTAMANGQITAEAYAKAMAMLGIAMSQVQTPDNILQQLRQQATRAGMGPVAGAGYDAAERVRLAGGTDEQVKEADRLGRRAYGAGQGSGLGEQIAGMRAGITGTAGVIAAYAQSTEAGRRAEIELRALEAQYKNGAAAVRAYADALLAQDAAQRRIEGARDLAKLKDDIADAEKLNAALAQSTVEYERQRIAIEAAQKVRQGYLTPAQGADYEAARLRQQTQEYERQAIALTRQLDPVARLNDELKTLAALQATGRLSAKAFEEAMTDAYVRAGQASDSWLQGATAGLLEYARQAQQVGAAMADAIMRSFAAADDVIAKLLLHRSVDLRQFLADISLDLTRTFVRQSITGPIAGFFGSLFTGGSGVTATGGNGATFSSGGIGGLLGGSGGSNPLSLLGGGSFNPFGIFGQGGSLGSFLQTPLFGAGGVFGSSLASAGSSLGGILGSVGGGGLTIANGLGALGGIGSGIFQLATGGGSLGSIIGGAGSLIGAGVSLIPGIGQIAGPIIGIASSILGGLFKSKPDIKAQGWHDYDVTTGRYTGGQKFAQGIAAPIAPGIGNDAIKLIQAFGGSVAPNMAPPEYYIWRGFEDGRMDATVTAEGSPTYARLLQEAFAGGAQGIDQAQWAARKALWTDAGNVDLPIGDLTKDSDKLMQQLALLILKAGVRDNAFAGLSGTSQSIIRNFPDADTQGLASALQWGKETYDVLVRTDTITESEKAITGLKDSFQAAILKAKEYGLATDALVAAQDKAINKYATDFGQNIEDQLLGLSDPAALQRVQVERAREQALKEWDYLNEQFNAGLIDTLIDRNKIQQLYDEQLNQIVSQQLTDLQDLWKRLTYGDLSSASPAATLAGAKSAYETTLAQAQSGSASALAGLSGAATDYINAQRLYTGNDARFESVRVGILSDIAPWVAANGNTGTGSSGVVANDQVAALMVSNAQLQAMVADLAQTVADLTRQLRQQAA